MLSNLQVGTVCAICDQKITDEEKEILKKTYFAQTWCLTCICKWANNYPMTGAKRNAILELRSLGIEISGRIDYKLTAR